MPSNTRAADKNRAKWAKIDEEVLQMRRDGVSVKKIGERYGKHETTGYRYVINAIERANQRADIHAETLRAQMFVRFQVAEEQLLERWLGDDPKDSDAALEKLLKVWTLWGKWAGLDIAPKINVGDLRDELRQMGSIEEAREAMHRRLLMFLAPNTQ